MEVSYVSRKKAGPPMRIPLALYSTERHGHHLQNEAGWQ